MIDPLDDQLTRMVQRHVDNHGAGPAMQMPDMDLTADTLVDEGEVVPVGGKRVLRADMKDADWKAAQDEAKGPAAARPGSVSAQMGSMVSGAAKPIVDLTKPLGHWTPPADAEMDGLKSDLKSRREGAKVGQAVADFTERPTNFLDYAQRLGGGGVSAPPPKSTMWKDSVAEGERNVADLTQKRAGDAAAVASHEKKDPKSQTAMTYRSVLLKFAPDLAGQLEGATPEQMEKIAPWLEKYAAENADVIKANAAATAKAQHDAEAKAQHAADQSRDDKWRATVHGDAQANAAAMRGMAADRVVAEKDAKDQAGAQHLAGKAEESQSMAAGLDDIDKTIAANPKDIPGIGRWKSLVPDVLKPLVLSDEGMQVRNDSRDVMAVLLHKRSGAAVSPAELSRYETMYGLNGTDEQFKAGMARMRRDAASVVAAEQAGVAPGARQKFKESGGTLAGDVGKTAKKVDHYLVSPDKKLRVPVYDDGTEGEEETQ